jgi:hypothetical protein
MLCSCQAEFSESNNATKSTSSGQSCLYTSFGFQDHVLCFKLWKQDGGVVVLTDFFCHFAMAIIDQITDLLSHMLHLPSECSDAFCGEAEADWPWTGGYQAADRVF